MAASKLCIKCAQNELTHNSIDHQFIWEPDHCEVCNGTKNGMKGNENRIFTDPDDTIRYTVMCDYCTVEWEDKRDAML